MATGGTEKFCFHFLQRRDFENAKYPGGKISPLIYYYNRQGAKWPGARTGNKKSSKSFSDLLLSLAADGRLVFSFESSGQVAPMMEVQRFMDLFFYKFTCQLVNLPHFF